MTSRRSTGTGGCPAQGQGRHDACVLPRAVPIVEAMAWLCLCDHYLRQRCQRAL
ncbi:MAG: chorismate synthase [Akkermansia sp.]